MKFDDAEIITAMVTPFGDNGQINYKSLKILIDELLSSGTKGILVSGTTGEAPTLTKLEKIELIKRTVEFVNGRVPIIAGTGSNNTAQTIEFTNEVSQIKGVDAALVVVPYYNKPNQDGMIAHFRAVADASKLPIVMYNIPGRTGVTMDVETIAVLSKEKNIIGIKDCTGNVNLSQIVAKTSSDFLTYTGEDADALAAKTIGAKGVISVASHIYGNEIARMYSLVDQGNYKEAGAVMRELTPNIKAIFSAPSPSPVKAILNYKGISVGGCRLPILELSKEQEKQLVKKLHI
ncbi:4-hydroxy-tetrahydrodipicolinate synthase [Liquorilactobacillus cacaonum]|uniref:4-hydroxy-tetrahydrodipicolinate synthase n=1 Tax=Liquorilactobacillus cacaonum DSM 21116 TaxID=1423729 RepID=A0A0R2CGG9_9LACO|nr:4-hydroxy-tetrahydrodipicolinate synthase [Liquorilactobacillus cacaonum]KRM90769.1 dihydrodipicolinate synthase [Liquorilactobacillus cacaonum DSM 21116]